MTFFERIVGGEQFVEVWKQLRSFVFKQSRWKQLLTLKPIEIYTMETELELDNSKVQLHIKAYLENLVQRRIERTRDLLSLNIFNWQRDRATYTFNVVINAQSEYPEISKFFDQHFAGRRYDIVENKYSIFLERFVTGADGTRACVELPFYVDARWWFIQRRMHGVAVFKGAITFNNPPFTIRTRNLNYTLQTKSWLLKLADKWYHPDIQKFLSGFIIYNFKEEIFHARIHAQDQLNAYQHENEWINGTVTDLELERITIDSDALRAVFLAKGKLQLVR